MTRVTHKFGGTSMAGAERIAHVADIVRAHAADHGVDDVAVVVSAMAGVTNRLFALAQAAAHREPSWSGTLKALIDEHTATAAALVDDDGARAALIAAIVADGVALKDLLAARAVLGGGDGPDRLDEVIAGFGEVLSARLLAARLGGHFVDARDVVVVDDGELGPIVDFELSKARLGAALVRRETGTPLVITGYVARTRGGSPTTLKRNGSDFSASIFGALLGADEVIIWTDVDGVLSADPRRVPEARIVPSLSYEEASELAYFGAKVVHPKTMQPAVRHGIPIRIKNTFHPERPGSVIGPAVPKDGAVDDGFIVKGFTTIDDVALLNLTGTGMAGVPGIAERLFGALRDKHISVMVISQASSEHSICIAVAAADADVAHATVSAAFGREVDAGAISGVSVERGCAIIAAVGDAMQARPGVAARFFRALADAHVNVRAVAQGSSERNITAVVDAAQSTRALRAVHAAFTLSATTLSVGVIGVGGIGRALVAQLQAQREPLAAQHGVDLRVRAITSSKAMRLGEDVVALAATDDGTIGADLDAFAAHVRAEHVPHAVIVDCSASDDVAERYAGWLKQGIHVVTPNKKAGSGPTMRAQAIAAAAAHSGARFYSEATVGAGLPIIGTLRELMRTGDRVIAIEGILSGTLSWLMNSLSAERPLSMLVREAHRLGYTEPDAREDLSGLDFARKLVVLAREAGRSLELADVVVEDLAPGVAFGLGIDDLVSALERDVDRTLAERHREAAARGEVLRYVGVIPEGGPPSVSLRAVPQAHAFSRLTGTDNIVAFRTGRYDAQPLVVSGPGAGPDVTAAGVFADLLRLSSHLGARV